MTGPRAGAAASVTITSVQSGIPGGESLRCKGDSNSVPTGQARELFPEIYGDYPLAFGRPDRRFSGDVLTALRFVDPLGEAGTLNVVAPITPGSLPTSYTEGSSPGWSCF